MLLRLVSIVGDKVGEYHIKMGVDATMLNMVVVYSWCVVVCARVAVGVL